MVYFIKVKDFPYYKIGVTKKATVEHRLATIQKMNPFKLEIYKVIDSDYSRQLETSFHKHFAEKRGYGEWFYLNEEDLNDIDLVQENFVPTVRKQFNKKSKPRTNYSEDINKIIRLLKESHIGQGKSTYKNESGFSGDTYQLVGNIFKLSSVTIRKLVRVYHYDPELLKEIDNHTHSISSAYNTIPKEFSVRVDQL